MELHTYQDIKRFTGLSSVYSVSCVCRTVNGIFFLLFTGPRPDWDPDIVAALDDDFNYNDPENQLEDDFISMANAGDGQEYDEE